jgi:hypothetical protein
MVTNSTRVGSLRRWFSIMSHEHHAKAQTGGQAGWSCPWPATWRGSNLDSRGEDKFHFPFGARYAS